MDNAFRTYALLKEEVKRWQAERGPFWLDWLSPVKFPPGYTIKDLPEKAVMELWQRLNEVSNLSVSDSILWEMWEDFINSQPVTNKELFSRLQMAICGVAGFWRESILKLKTDWDTVEQRDYAGQGITCPICGELAGVSILSPPNGRRYLHCLLCGHEWLAKRVGCLRCGNEEAANLNYLNSEDYPGVEIIVCQTCGQYAKEYDLRVRNVEDIEWETIRTLSLDYAAEKWLAVHMQLLGKAH